MTTASLSLQPLTAVDEPVLQGLFDAVKADEVASWGWTVAEGDPFLALQHRGWRASFDRTEVSVVVDGGPVGWLVVRRTPKEVRVVDVALLPEHRGHGLGTTLLQVVRADAQGLPVRLSVLRDSRALRLYQRLGFEITGCTATHLAMEWRDA